MTSQSEYLDFVLSKNKPIPDYTIKLMEFVLKAHEIIKDENITALKNLTSTPESIANLCTVAKNYGEYVNAFLTVSSKFKPVYNAPTKQECKDDFAAIKNDLTDDSLQYDIYSPGFLFKREIVMNDVYRDIKFNFGRFQFYLKNDKAEMMPIGNNTEKNGQYHPYIIKGTNKICLGTYDLPYKSAMASMRYHLAYTIVMQCVTEYGGDMLNGTAAGPQNPIMLWVGQVCSVCDDAVKTEEMSVCGKTNRAICPKCIDSGICTDETDDEIYHPDVIKECKSCNKKSASVIRGKCLVCRKAAVGST